MWDSTRASVAADGAVQWEIPFYFIKSLLWVLGVSMFMENNSLLYRNHLKKSRLEGEEAWLSATEAPGSKGEWEETHPEIPLFSHHPRAIQDHLFGMLPPPTTTLCHERTLILVSFQVLAQLLPLTTVLWAYLHGSAQSPRLLCSTLPSPYSSARPLRGRARVKGAGSVTSSFSLGASGSGETVVTAGCILHQFTFTAPCNIIGCVLRSRQGLFKLYFS